MVYLVQPHMPPLRDYMPFITALAAIFSVAYGASINRNLFRCFAENCLKSVFIAFINSPENSALNGELEVLLDRIKQKLTLCISFNILSQIANQEHILYEVLRCMQSILRLTSILASPATYVPQLEWKQQIDRSYYIDKIAALRLLTRSDVVSYLLSECPDALAVRLMSIMQAGLFYFPQRSRQRLRLAWSLLKLQTQRKVLLPNLNLSQGEVKHTGNKIIKSHKDYDIYEGDYLMHELCIIKTFRGIPSNKKIFELFLEEVERWRSLFNVDKGAHVIPCWGVYTEINNKIGLVYPRLGKGHILEYLECNPGVDRKALIKYIATGLKIMHGHNPPIIHGDLRAANIVLNDLGQPIMTNLAFSTNMHNVLNVGSHTIDETRNAAPEFFESEANEWKPTPASDVYAFAMTALEIFTEKLTFAHIPSGTSTRTISRILTAITSGIQPERPQGNVYVERGLDDGMWELLQSCWAKDPAARPSIDEVISMMAPA